MSRATSFLQLEPQIGLSHTGLKGLLAYEIARGPWPSIVAATQEDVETTLAKQQAGTAEAEEGRLIVQDLRKLVNDIANDARLLPITDDGTEVVQDFNAELELLGPLTWLKTPWLFAECYLYRLINSMFATRETHFWKSYDCFRERKSGSLKSSKTMIVELLQWYNAIEAKAGQDVVADQQVLQALLEELLEICLWGNSVDLLLLVLLPIDELQSKQGNAARVALRKNIVSNDTDKVWTFLSSAQQKSVSPREIHIVLDNAGFECTGDLVLACFLLSLNFADKIVLHGKDIPWFISDVTAQDLETTLRTLESPADSFADRVTEAEASCLKKFATEVRRYLSSGQLEYRAHQFWTTQHSFSRMASLAPDLLSELQSAALVIFKGDLNYRKLLMDGLWPRTTTFQTALGPLADVGLRILAIRTAKSDVVVGLPDGLEAEIDVDGTGMWVSGGKYGVISFHDGKSEMA